MAKGEKTCTCGHHTTIPVLMILFAVTFLLGNQGYLTSSAVQTIWPILVGIAGLVKLAEHHCGCC
ncbi:hypothetical protein KW783_04060 [Candidatus Parcubacteria bacterium]|nr:hypothetical protein [Candidatus Parcubacteria bacterium]